MSKPVTKTYYEAESQSINIISKGTKITGNIVADGDIRIDGELKGNISAKGRLVVGATGSIEGEIACNNIEVSGAIKGKIKADELLSLKATSRVSGDIVLGKLSVEPGAEFTGTCKMGNSPIKNEPES